MQKYCNLVPMDKAAVDENAVILDVNFDETWEDCCSF